jgi:DNA-binding MarR family transcriptional regulator
METPIDTQLIESFIGYNARRAAAYVFSLYYDNMASYGLKPVEFTVLSLVMHNPGVTSRQICQAIAVQAPNLVKVVAKLDERGWLTRHKHSHDARAIGLHLTAEGRKLTKAAEKTAREFEQEAVAHLSAAEQKQLISLLQKVYSPPTKMH